MENTTNLNKDLKIISNRKHGARKTERGEEKPPTPAARPPGQRQRALAEAMQHGRQYPGRL